MSDENVSEFVVVACSDEKKFLEYISTQFTKVIYYQDFIRSSLNTSGLQKDFSDLKYTNTDNPDYRKLKDNSIHFGFKKASNYLKGKQVLLDCLLVAEANYIFISQSNLGDYISHLKKSDSKVFKIKCIQS